MIPVPDGLLEVRRLEALALHGQLSRQKAAILVLLDAVRFHESDCEHCRQALQTIEKLRHARP